MEAEANKGKRVHAPDLVKFLKPSEGEGPLEEGSRLAGLLKEQGTNGDELLEALRFLDVIEGEGDTISVERFIREAFDLGRDAKRHDILEVLAEIKSTIVALTEDQSIQFDNRIMKQDDLAMELAAKIEKQDQEIESMHTVLKEKDDENKKLQTDLIKALASIRGGGGFLADLGCGGGRPQSTLNPADLQQGA